MWVPSGLGPSLYACPQCNTTFPSGRIEWPHMSVPGKLWYIVNSSALAVFLGLFGGTLIAWSVLCLQGGVRAKFEPSGAAYIAGILAWGCLIALLQALRIRQSLMRVRAGETGPFRPRFWSIVNGLQFKMAMAIWIPPILAFVVRKTLIE